ncbi:MAG: class I SAM-dependent methyltransferase [Pseudomonadota bacterium]|nr:MAG: hypothetical protein DIU72_03235 [Pseudomonadota bacterium]
MDREGEETGILAKRCLGCKGKGGLLRGDFMAGFDPSARTATLTLEQEAPARFPLRDGRGRPWWESYFGSDYSLLYPEKDHASGEKEAPRIAAALALAPGARVLDLGCGNGRHVLALARRGFDVTGIDFSTALLEEARAARESEGLSCQFVLADARNLPIETLPPFDAVISIFTSFGLFSEVENEAVARNMAACLKPGGRLLLDLGNRALLESASGQRVWSRRPGGYLLDEFFYDADTHRFHGNRILITDGVERRYPFDHRAYSEPEIRALLRKVGLRVLAVHGSLDRTPFNPRSPRMVVLAEKP